MKIYEVSQRMELIHDSIEYFWDKWGDSKNYNFYKDSIMNSLDPGVDLSKFYIALTEDTIIGSYALLRNDLISRQDLVPWFACFYVDPNYRGKKVGAVLLDHAAEQAKLKEYNRIFLSTTLENYYEKYGWEFVDYAYYINGDRTKVYSRTL
ncbi:MAG: acetyltransferase [Paenibacillus sp.]|jgi:GNAT superfamily N-acetyltransferase|nr:acetyltransferase [Paenibacillus sp.]